MGTPVKKTKYEVVAPSSSKYEVVPPPKVDVPQEKTPDSALTRYATNVVGDPRKDVQGVKDKGLVGYLKEQGRNAIQSLNPLPAMQDTYQSAVRGWNSPQPNESTLGMIDRKVGSAGRFIESGVPYLGPALAHASEQFDSGDVAGGLGTSTLLGVGAVAGDPNVRAGITTLPGKVAEFAKHPIATPKAALVGGMDKLALGDFTPEQILTKAIKPPVTYPEFEDVVHNRLPEIANASRNNPITSVKGFTRIADELAAKNNQKYQNQIGPFRQPTATIGGREVPAIGPYRPANIDANPVADAQIASIPSLDLFERPNRQTEIQRGGHHIMEGDEGILSKTQQKASPFRREIPIGNLDAIRVDSNAKLNSFYNKAGGDQYAALSDPETARMKAINDTSRDLVYDRLQKETGIDPRPAQNAFGDYTDLGNVAGKRATVYGRQQPFPLQETLNVADSLTSPGKFLLSRAFKRYGNSDTLTKIALDKFNQQPTEAPAPNPFGIRKPAIGSIAASMRKKSDDER